MQLLDRILPNLCTSLSFQQIFWLLFIFRFSGIEENQNMKIIIQSHKTINLNKIII